MDLLPVTIGDMNCFMDANTKRLYGAVNLQRLVKWFADDKPTLMFESWGAIRVLSVLETGEKLVLVTQAQDANIIFRVRENEIHYFNCFIGLLTGWEINPDNESVTGRMLEFFITNQGKRTYVPRTYLYNLTSGEKIKI